MTATDKQEILAAILASEARIAEQIRRSRSYEVINIDAVVKDVQEIKHILYRRPTWPR
jgi:hypothetical protein